MTDDAVADLVRRAHDGEVLGEALFARMAALESDPSRQRLLRGVELLERQTKATAAALARHLDVDLGDGSGPRDAGVRAAESFATLAWHQRMRAVADATASYRALYEELAAALGGRHQAEVEALLAHERAVNDFASAESRGQADSEHFLVQALDEPARRELAARQA